MLRLPALLLVLLYAPSVLAQDSVWVRNVLPPQYFAVYVQDVDRSVRWYRTALGMEKAGGSEADDGAWRIENLRNAHLLVELIFDRRAEYAERALGFAKVGFQVPDVDVIADRILRATGSRPRIVTFESFGLRILQLDDPDGNVIQLTSLL